MAFALISHRPIFSRCVSVNGTRREAEASLERVLKAQSMTPVKFEIRELSEGHDMRPGKVVSENS